MMPISIYFSRHHDGTELGKVRIVPQKQKTDFLRGLVLFNPRIHPPNTPQNRDRIAGKIADYDAADGGRWNYDDFYRVVVHVLKGASFDQAMSHLRSLEGVGEAAAKTSLLAFIDKHMDLRGSEFVESGPRHFQVDANTKATIAPDFACKREGVIYQAFVYPKREPALSQLQRDMIKSLMSRPLADNTDDYVLCLIEYPAIGGKRVGRYEEFPFGYYGVSEDFSAHMADFYGELSNSRGGQGTLI